MSELPKKPLPKKLSKVVIIGAGFGGLNAAKALGDRPGIEVVLLDRRNYHLFQPLLYQVATAGLSPADIAMPIRSIVADFKNITVKLENVLEVDLRAKKLRLAQKDESYDYLILACGAKHSYFDHPEWEDHAPGLKTLEQATEIRRRVLLAFEQAENEPDPQKQKEWLTFVIVGGGPTGVELAGALAEISRTTLLQDFRHIDPRRTRVILVEAGARILASFDASLSARAAQDLEQMGVQIWTSSRVTEVTANGIVLREEHIRAATVIWAAGVQPSSLNQTLNVPLDRSGRVIVRPDLTLEQHPEVFVIGDQANFVVAEDGTSLPGVASVALQQGKWAARNILREVKGEPLLPFRYLDKGQMATMGKRRAILQWGRLKMSGAFAWLIWLGVHIFFLIGFKNRLSVLSQWAWSYMTAKRSARLIMSKDWKLPRKGPVVHK